MAGIGVYSLLLRVLPAYGPMLLATERSALNSSKPNSIR
jgi:hypothetical protein